MSDSLQKRVNQALRDLQIWNLHNLHDISEAVLAIVIPEINQAWSEALKQAAEHRPNHNYNGDITSCIACDWRSTPYPKNNRDVNEWEEHVAKLSSVQQEAPPKTCKICGGIGENHVDTIERRDDDPAAPTDISGERQRGQDSASSDEIADHITNVLWQGKMLNTKDFTNTYKIVQGLIKQELQKALSATWAAPQQTTASQREPSE